MKHMPVKSDCGCVNSAIFTTMWFKTCTSDFHKIFIVYFSFNQICFASPFRCDKLNLVTFHKRIISGVHLVNCAIHQESVLAGHYSHQLAGLHKLAGLNQLTGLNNLFDQFTGLHKLASPSQLTCLH